MSKPYVPQKSRTKFYIPPTLADDFASFLNNDVPNTVMNFTLLPDWYTQFEENYEPTVIRGLLYPDSTKSRYSDTDNNLNFRSAMDSGTKKGDMVIDENDVIYLLDWEISPQPNNRASRALRCNARMTFTRFQREQVDRDGYLIAEEGYVPIVSDLPVNAYRYDGRPEYSAHAGAPGVTPNALTMVSLQYNNQTKNIRIDDEFVWRNDTYVVVDINPVGMNIDGNSGVLAIQAKKKAGGIV